MSTDAERYLLSYMIVVLVIVSALIILFFIVFQRRKNRLLLDKIKQKQLFDEEIVKTQTEIQEETLKNVGRELHDNVGQLLSFASMQLNLLATQVNESLKNKVEDTKEVVLESIQEVRALSKALNNDIILNVGLHKSVQNEIDRLNKLRSIKAELSVEGKEISLADQKHEIILFRILQEFFSNTVKYSDAGNIWVKLIYSDTTLQIEARDNGKGFDKDTIEPGAGLINMKNRAAMIHAKFSIDSKPDEGVLLQVNYPLNKAMKTI